MSPLSKRFPACVSSHWRIWIVSAAWILHPAAHVFPASAGTPVTILECTFDDEPINEIVETGGAEAGQPSSLGAIEARVRDFPFATPALEIPDHWGSGARSVSFNFLGFASIETGQLVIETDLYFTTPESYHIYIREAFGFATTFLNLYFTVVGEIRYVDLDTVGNPLIGTYATGRPQALRIAFDLDAGTYDVSFDGAPLLTGESMGSAPTGIGKVLVGISSDANSIGTVYLDGIRVEATEPPSPVESASWAGLKALYR